jgi:hypothetical protein
MTNYNVAVAQMRMEAVGLPYNGIDSLVVLRSKRKNSAGFEVPEIPLDGDSDDDVTYAGFALGGPHAYGNYIEGDLFPEWKQDGHKKIRMEDV